MQCYLKVFQWLNNKKRCWFVLVWFHLKSLCKADHFCTESTLTHFVVVFMNTECPHLLRYDTLILPVNGASLGTDLQQHHVLHANHWVLRILVWVIFLPSGCRLKEKKKISRYYRVLLSLELVYSPPPPHLEIVCSTVPSSISMQGPWRTSHTKWLWSVPSLYQPTKEV